MGSSPGLSSRDSRLLLTLADDLAACRDERGLREQLDTLPRRLGANSILVSGMSQTADHQVFTGDPALYSGEMLRAVTRHWQDHPVLVADRTSLIRGARRLSDYVGREWFKRGLFAEFYRPLGMTREISVRLSQVTDGSTLCFVLHRAGRDFGERERAMMEHLSPHVRAAYLRVCSERTLSQRTELFERGVKNGIIVGGGGRLVAVGATARDALERWFGRVSSTLPARLREWWAAARLQPTGPTLELRRGGAVLQVELVAGAEEDLILITERDQSLAPAILARRLPITSREAEVLALLSEGRTNEGIAFDLGISRHTVVRHVEQIYRKLDTSSRAAATRAALEALRD